MRHPSRSVFVLALALLTIGISTPQNSASAQTSRILQGIETDDYEAVGIVGSQAFGGFCTGTLITDSHVLTAAHCAEVIEGPTSGTFEVLGRVYESVDVFVHPDYNPDSLANDIAIIQLGEPVLEVLPAEIFRGEPLVGDFLYIVGFGSAGTAQDGSDNSFGTKRVGTTTIDEVTRTLVSWNYDDTSEANTATGDSGGPGFLDIDGDLFIACITSGGTEPDSNLGDFAFNTRVDAFAEWIDLTILSSIDPGDDPANDPPQDSGVGEGDGGCDSFWSCVFGTEDVSPFPLLQLLIDALTTILDWLNDVDAQLQADGAGSDPPAAEQPAGEEPAGEQPAGEQPADCPVTQPPATEDPGTEDPGTEEPGTEDPGTEDPGTEEPTTEDPVILDPVTGEPITIPPGTIPPGTIPPGTIPPGTIPPGTIPPGTIPPGTIPPGTIPGGIGGIEGIQLPPAGATELVIRRWMLENPSLRDLVKHRL